jgi:cytochrome b
MRDIRVWDPFVRIFHWLTAAMFAANAVVTDPEGRLHYFLGLTIAGLLVLRLAWGFVGTRHARFADFPPSPGAAMTQLGDMATGRRHAHAGHSPLGAFMIYNLLLTLVVICLSGWMMTTLAFFGIGWVEELHEAAVTWAEISVAAHIVAVLVESRRLGINLPLSMISGRKRMPD